MKVELTLQAKWNRFHCRWTKFFDIVMDLRLQSDLSVSIQQSHMHIVVADWIAKYPPDRKACKDMQCVSAPKIAVKYHVHKD